MPPFDNCGNSVQWCVLSLVLLGSVGYLNLGLTFSRTEYDALNVGALQNRTKAVCSTLTWRPLVLALGQ